MCLSLSLEGFSAGLSVLCLSDLRWRLPFDDDLELLDEPEDEDPEEPDELDDPDELPDELDPLVFVSFLEEGALAAFFAPEEFIIVRVTPPTLPSAVSPARFWNAFTASSVISPKYPVAFALER